jgi:hypothetical protein
MALASIVSDATAEVVEASIHWRTTEQAHDSVYAAASRWMDGQLGEPVVCGGRDRWHTQRLWQDDRQSVALETRGMPIVVILYGLMVHWSRRGGRPPDRGQSCALAAPRLSSGVRPIDSRQVKVEHDKIT